MMYTVQQLQAADFILKRITKMGGTPFCGKKLKIVIEINNIYWYGDFVISENRTVKQYFIDDYGEVDYSYIYSEGSNASISLKKIQDAYINTIPKGEFIRNPFHSISTLDLLFNTVFKIVKKADIQVEDSIIYPYLLNAKSIDGSLQLPFINLENQQIQAISLILVEDSDNNVESR